MIRFDVMVEFDQMDYLLGFPEMALKRMSMVGRVIKARVVKKLLFAGDDGHVGRRPRYYMSTDTSVYEPESGEHLQSSMMLTSLQPMLCRAILAREPARTRSMLGYGESIAAMSTSAQIE
jgi:hypothetical protein